MRGKYVVDPTGRTPSSFLSMEALIAAHGHAFDGDPEITYMSSIYELDPCLTLVEPPSGLRDSPDPIEWTPSYGPNRKTRRTQAALARRRGSP